MPRSLRTLWAALLLAAIAGMILPSVAQTQAQATTGIIRGMVTDERATAVAGATVTLRNTETNVTRVVRTTEIGLYVGTLLSLGRYEVSVRAVGFEPVAQRDIVVRVGQVLEVPFSLKRSTTTLAAVTVTDRANTPVDATRTESATTLNDATVGGIPNNGRNFLALTLVTPNVAVTQGPDGDVLSVAGQRGMTEAPPP